jgi:hypothetical protein
MVSKVWVELSAPGSGVAVAIYPSRKSAYEQVPPEREFIPGELLMQMDRAKATKQIRDAIWERCKGVCELCRTRRASEMHERQPRGKFVNGHKGTVSVRNGVAACWPCHQGPGGAHWDRRVRLAEHRLRS